MAAEGKFVALNQQLYEYVVAHGHNGDPLLRELAGETARLGPVSEMQIAPEQGTFMSLLVHASGARNAIEIGTFTGYSAICVARALPENGTLLCCDVSEDWTAVARRYWEKAGLTRRITLKLGPAVETVRALPAGETFDFAFIDADKSNYHIYYEEVLRRLRANGLILIDNVIWGGEVLNPRNQTDDTRAIRELNDFLASDERVEVVMLPLADGLTICRKK
ncbi:MAG: O-methyltransferase [Candidatus Binataceae bacterium]